MRILDVSAGQTPQPSAPRCWASPPQHQSSLQLLFPGHCGTRSTEAVTATLPALPQCHSLEGRTLLHEGRSGPMLGNGHGKPCSDAQLPGHEPPSSRSQLSPDCKLRGQAWCCPVKRVLMSLCRGSQLKIGLGDCSAYTLFVSQIYLKLNMCWGFFPKYLDLIRSKKKTEHDFCS